MIGNVVSGSAWAAWVVPGYSCSLIATPKFEGNVGSSSKIGWLATASSSPCVAYGYFTAFLNSQFGFLSTGASSNFIATSFTLADNKVGLLINAAMSQEDSQMQGQLLDSIVIARSRPDCGFCYSSQADCGAIGLTTSFWSTAAAPPLPYSDATLAASLEGKAFAIGAKFSVSNVHFRKFQQDPACLGKVFAMQTNPNILDASALIKLEQLRLTDTDENILFLFNSPTLTPATLSTFCSTNTCTGLSNVVAYRYTSDTGLPLRHHPSGLS